MTGDMDYLLRAHVEDLEYFTCFMMDRLLKQTGVTDVKSNFVLEKVKDTTADALRLSDRLRATFAQRLFAHL